MPDLLRDIGLLFAGVAMGSAITPEMLEAIGPLPPLAVLSCADDDRDHDCWSLRAGAFLRVAETCRALRLAAGAMSAVLATSAAAASKMSRIAMVQAFRMFVLVAILPTIVTMSATTGRVAEAQVMTAPAFALVMAFAVGISFPVRTFPRSRALHVWRHGGSGITHATVGCRARRQPLSWMPQCS